MLGRFRRRRKHTDHDDVTALLHQLEKQKARLDRRDVHPNAGYRTPLDGGQTPGVNPDPLGPA